MRSRHRGSHVLLAGTGCGALTVAAIVEGEDVEAEVVEAGEGGDGVGERAVGRWGGRGWWFVRSGHLMRRGIHQPVSCGVADSSGPKWMSS